MVLKNYIDKLKDNSGEPINLKRPKGVSLEQWNTALEIYKSAKKQGDKYPELTVAQAALESSWFKRSSGNFNFFGQKASKSQRGTEFKTKEVKNNKAYSTTAKFRDYENFDEALGDRVNKWSSKYNSAENVEDAIYKIWQYDPETGKGTGYATDDKYDVKIKKILGMIGVPLTKTTEQKLPSKTTKTPNFNPESTATQDSLDPSYYMEDIINDSKDQVTQEQVNPIQKLFEIQSQSKQREKEFVEKLKTMSFKKEEPLQVEPIQDNSLDQLFSDNLYNYINLDTY